MIIKKITSEEKLVYNWKIYLDMVGKNGISKMVLRKTLPIINANLANLLGDVCDFDVEVSISLLDVTVLDEETLLDELLPLFLEKSQALTHTAINMNALIKILFFFIKNLLLILNKN